MCAEWTWTSWQWLACVGWRAGVWWWWCVCVCVCVSWGGVCVCVCVAGGGTTVSVSLKLRCELFFSTDFHELTFSLDFHDILTIWFHLVAAAETALSCQLGGNTALLIDVCVYILSRAYTVRRRWLLTAGMHTFYDTSHDVAAKVGII